MTTTVQGSGSANGEARAAGRWLRPGAGAAGADRLPVARRQRRPLTIAAGVLVLAVSGAVGGAVAVSGDHAVAVLTLTRPVSAGQVLSNADLGTAHISGSGVHGMAASAANGVVGQTVLANLPAGTLLTAQMLTASSVPASGQQVVAVALKPGAFPPDLQAGRAVSVLQVAPPSGGSSVAPGVLVARAPVLGVRSDTASGLTVVSLVVNGSRALAVAQASAAGAVSLGLLPVGS